MLDYYRVITDWRMDPWKVYADEVQFGAHSVNFYKDGEWVDSFNNHGGWVHIQPVMKEDS